MSHTILIVEDNPITRKLFRITLESADYVVLEAPDGKTALEHARTGHPALIIQDLLLPDIHGIELNKRLREMSEASNIPIIAVTGLLSKLDEAKAFNGNFTDHLLKPVEPSKLLEVVEMHLPNYGAHAKKLGKPQRILLVDDDPVGLKLQKALLEEQGFEVSTAKDGQEAFEKALKSRPDAVLADLIMPRLNGFELTMKIRNDRRLKNIPVVVTSSTFSLIEKEDIKTARALGATTFVLRTPKLEAAIEALQKALKEKTRPAKPKKGAPSLLRQVNHRLIRQLEAQAALRTKEIRRSTLENARLSVLTGVAEVLNRKLDLGTAIQEALTRTLDASGVSVGAIYLPGEDGALRLEASLGLTEEETTRLPDLFGHRELLEQTFREGKAIVAPSPAVKPEQIKGLLEQGFARSLVLIPLIAGDAPQGVLLLASVHRELVEDWVDLAGAIGIQLAQAVLLSRTHMQLSESEQRFREIAENIKEVFFVTGAEGSPVLYVSPAFEEITGYTRESLNANPHLWRDMVHPEDRAAVDVRCRELLERFDQEYRIVRPDGEIRWIHTRTFPVEDNAGRLTRIVGTSEDITARRQAQEEVQRNLERIRALHEIDLAITSTLNLHTVLDFLLEKIDLFLPYPAATTVRLFNKENGFLEPVACRNLNEAVWKEGEGKTGRGLAKVVFETKAALAVRDVQADPRIRDRQFFRRYSLVSYLGVPLIAKKEALGVLNFYTKEGHQFSEEEVEFLKTLAGQAAIAIHNARLYEQSKKREMELARANKVKDEFLSVMSHELRTPLNVVVGYTGMIRDGMLGEVNPQQAEALDKVIRRTNDQLALVNNILYATVLESETVAVETQDFNLEDFLNQLKLDYEAPINKELSLAWDYAFGLPNIRTDSAKLKHILRNLIDNALKFTSKGSVTVSARIIEDSKQKAEGSLQRAVGSGQKAESSIEKTEPRPTADRLLPTGGKWVEFKVADTGVGIPKDALPFVFDKFKQVDSSETRSFGGVGMGLYIVRKFTEMLGGTVEVESEVGKGSAFTVRIPCQF